MSWPLITYPQSISNIKILASRGVIGVGPTDKSAEVRGPRSEARKGVWSRGAGSRVLEPEPRIPSPGLESRPEDLHAPSDHDSGGCDRSPQCFVHGSRERFDWT